MPARRLLLAGSWGPERVPARPHPEDADWYLPLHVRDPRDARDRLATQVAAGADVIVAPSWLTHRRALLPLGETRRAAAWTAGAVRVAREGVEAGLERLDLMSAEATDEVPGGRPLPLVAATLPALDDDPEPGTGRLLPRETATVRDYRDQAGLLADADPDLLLVEGQQDEAGARVAIGEAVTTGLPVWAAIGVDALSTTDLEDWLEWGGAVGLHRLLLPPPLEALGAAAVGDLPWGAAGPQAESIPAWLEAGADAVAQLDGASIAALGPLRSAIDDFERAGLEATSAAERRWHELIAMAGSMAPGGAALWLGSPPDAPLPDGFAWLVIEAAAWPQLPSGHYRLVIAAGDDMPDVGRLLQRGGILAQRGAPTPRGEVTLRPLLGDDSAEPALSVWRRED